MDYVSQEINDILMHVGVSIKDGAPGRGSGRYPLGSGANPYQHQEDFVGRVQKLRSDGKSWQEIAEELQIIGPSGRPSSGKAQIQYQAANNDLRLKQYTKMQELRDQGYTYDQIAEMTGVAGESTVRMILKDSSRIDRAKAARVTADYLKNRIAENPNAAIDVGEYASELVGISDGKLNEALYLLELEGYHVYGNYQVPQSTNQGKNTTYKLLVAPDVQYKDLYHTPQDGKPIDIRMIDDSHREILTDDGNDTVLAWQYPASLDSKRLQVVYGDQGGKEKDGLVELRRGVADLDLGDDTHYAQVRILVDGTHYIKGMAAYADDLEPGIDVRFNTNKDSSVPIMSPNKKDKQVLKPINDDPNNPFNSLIKEKGGQYEYIGEDGEKHLGLINKRADQGDWTDWADSLPTQFLSKQPKKLILQQLDIAYNNRADELNDILQITNPVVKEDRLLSFALECDTAAVTLKAAPFPNQKWHVILPVPEMGETEIFAPRYENGTKVALVRYPHAGTYEIPILTVNNNKKKAQKLIGMDSEDAVGISKTVADRLSGADFDGDTVMLIPTHDPKGKVKITSTPQLKGLKDFDPQAQYPERPGMRYMTKKDTQKEMGIISNLITDMTLAGADEDQLARAVRHSMVVIDAEKHKLDYKRSEIENGIDELKRIYQVNPNNKKGYGGAGTLISRAKSEVRIPKRKGEMQIDEEGNAWYKTAPDSERFYDERKTVYKKDAKGRYLKDADGNKIPETYTDPRTGRERPVKIKTGKQKERQDTVPLMSVVDDAHKLSSGYEKEEIYADYANAVKELARKARKEAQKVEAQQYSKNAAEVYAEEVKNLEAQLHLAKLNKPYERRAQAIANSRFKSMLDNDDSLYANKAEQKKERDRQLKRARKEVGAQRYTIKISPKQWEAIQAGAVRKSVLKEILNFADDKQINQYAMPKRNSNQISVTLQNRIRSYSNSNYSLEQIAKATGLSVNTVAKYLHEKG